MSDIIGYQYRADLYCVDCIHVQMEWPAFMARQTVDDAEATLDTLADERGIDRDDEHSFDSGYFPKRVLEGTLEGDEHCGQCGEPFGSGPSPATLAAARERVSKGAALLDARCQGWAALIDLDELSIASGVYCILGQVFEGGYCYGLETLGLGDSESVAHGFCGEDDRYVDALDTTWDAAVRARLADEEG